jgi:hypothetical protein
MNVRKRIYVVNKDGTKTDINVKPPIKHYEGCRAGNFKYKGFEIPIHSIIITDTNKEECYLSSVFIKEEVWFATVCYFMRTKDLYYTMLYDKIAPYLK